MLLFCLSVFVLTCLPFLLLYSQPLLHLFFLLHYHTALPAFLTPLFTIIYSFFLPLSCPFGFFTLLFVAFPRFFFLFIFYFSELFLCIDLLFLRSLATLLYSFLSAVVPTWFLRSLIRRISSIFPSLVSYRLFLGIPYMYRPPFFLSTAIFFLLVHICFFNLFAFFILIILVFPQVFFLVLVIVYFSDLFLCTDLTFFWPLVIFLALAVICFRIYLLSSLLLLFSFPQLFLLVLIFYFLELYLCTDLTFFWPSALFFVLVFTCLSIYLLFSLNLFVAFCQFLFLVLLFYFLELSMLRPSFFLVICNILRPCSYLLSNLLSFFTQPLVAFLQFLFLGLTFYFLELFLCIVLPFSWPL